MPEPSDVVIRPVVTEKSSMLVEDRKYVFEVHPQASKHEVAEAIEALFRVEVSGVNVMNIQGKPRRYGRFSGFRSSRRKAVVTLSEGHTIDVYPGA